MVILFLRLEDGYEPAKGSRMSHYALNWVEKVLAKPLLIGPVGFMSG